MEDDLKQRGIADRTFAVLMAGGAGTRFWPLSRRARPKQVLPIADARPMIRATLDRVGDLTEPSRVLVVTGFDQAEPIRAALPEVPEENFLLEPAPRNTAPCIGLAAVTAAARDPDALLLCLPADHVIRPEEEFRETCSRALSRADAAKTLLTFGVAPDHPATGYGYIQEGEETAAGVRRVERFTEKPALEEAKRFIEEGVYRWNSGMFAWRADVFLAQLQAHQPEIAEGLAAIRDEPDRLAEVFPGLPSISVDYAVLERTDRAEVVQAEFHWDDLGSFESLARLLEAEEGGHRAGGQLLAVDSEGLITSAPEGHLVAALGVKDLVIVVTRDATLVCPRDRVEEIKRIVGELAPRGRADLA